MQTNGKRISPHAAVDTAGAVPWTRGKCLVDCQNVGQTERSISALVGGALLAGGLRHPAAPAALLKLAVGGGLMYRAATGFCGIYKALGINTAEATDLGALQDQQLMAARKHPDLIDEASRESFPASDPPGWTSTSASRSM